MEKVLLPVLCLCLASAVYAAPADTTTSPSLNADTVADIPMDDISVEACFSSLNTWPVATETCAEALTRPNTDATQARLHSALALQHARLGQIQAAQTSINNALALQPADPVVQANLGNIYLLNGNFTDAVTAYGNALEGLRGSIHDAVVYLNRSLALRALGRYSDAQLDYAAYFDTLNTPAPVDSMLPQQVIGVDQLSPGTQTR